MIRGVVTPDRTPVVAVRVAWREWDAVIDSGFNGDLELPEELRRHVNATFTGQVLSMLAGGQEVLEDSYEVDFPFDGRVLRVVATFVEGAEILIGTRLVRDYRLTIDFVQRTVELVRADGSAPTGNGVPSPN